jgi:glycosyltransferase involved in cell wall biosynthesis
MKILHTEASCGWGGQEIRILSEASGMIERGHQVQLLCPAEARIFTEAPRSGVPVTALPIGRKKLSGVLALRRWLKANPVDVINTHSSSDSWLAALACLFWKEAPPIVRTRHISAPIPNNAPTRWMYTQATRHIATTGEKLRQTLHRDNGYSLECLTSVPTGIDTNRFAPPSAEQKAAARASCGLPADGLVFGIVATLRSWKGHRYLLDAFAAVAPPDARLLIVGDGPQFDALQERIAELGLSDRVTMPGNQNDVVPWMHAMDIFALPSYANEGVPQALMQALCCGLPAVTTHVGSIGELAIDGETALVVPPQDSAALADALALLAADPALRLRLGTAARRHVAARFARETMLDRMETIFAKVVAERGPR